MLEFLNWLVLFVTRKVKNGNEDMSVDVLASCLGDALQTESFFSVIRCALRRLSYWSVFY